MSRSVRRTPIAGLDPQCSEKEAKREANRRLRRAVRQALHRGVEILPLLREVSNVWGFPKDGKRWFGSGGPPWTSYDREPDRYRRLMRK